MIERRQIRRAGLAPWLRTHKGDRAARFLADHHYSRQKPGTPSFTRPGNNLVYILADETAVWVTHRPEPGKAKRQDGLDAWECTLFRNIGPVLSSELIRKAVAMNDEDFGPRPKDGLITFVRPECVQSPNPGYCFKCAGWTVVGKAKDGKPMLRAPA